MIQIRKPINSRAYIFLYKILITDNKDKRKAEKLENR